MNFCETVKECSGIEVTQDEIDAYMPEAKEKLERIISREGDAADKRREPRYLAILLADIVRANRLSDFCSEVCDVFADTIKESIQRDTEILPQTTISVS